MPRVFIIRAFGEKADSKGNQFNFDRVQSELMDPALKAFGLSGGTTAEIRDSGNIREDMFALILEADLVICDITIHNANVFYELGIRHALKKKHTLLLKADPSADATPFDLSTDRYLKYPAADPKAALSELMEKIRASLNTQRETDSPIFLLMPGLAEADASRIRVVPIDLVEEIDRAEQAGDKGLLRVIAQDLTGLRFETEGLRRVARAQWNLKDAAGARMSWERLWDTQPNDVEACLALANIYERLFRSERRDALLERSNQMVDRVIASPLTPRDQQAEALALKGRNFKTLWRQRFEPLADPAQALAQALDRRAVKSYQAYLRAFEMDLNSYYPGLAALQMGMVLERLMTLPGWRGLFGGEDRDAREFREDLSEDLPELRHTVLTSIRRQLRETDEKSNSEKRLWAEVARADLMFLDLPAEPSEEDIESLVQAYESVIPDQKRFIWDAARGQLQLFQSLGIQRGAAEAVCRRLDARFPEEVFHKALLVVFVGHNVDAPGAPIRFPESAEGAARQRIRQTFDTILTEVPPEVPVVLLASAARGADLLAHEVWHELQRPSWLCLPLPAERVAAHAFSEADRWRQRFHQVSQRHDSKRTLVMSESEALPRWLHHRPEVDPWERGNRWVMETARAWGAMGLKLVALWNGEDDGRSGGTAHLVRIAKADGQFRLVAIDPKELI